MIACRDLASRGLDISNLSLSAGLSAVIGLNGAGKTTLLELATGLLLFVAAILLEALRLALRPAPSRG